MKATLSFPLLFGALAVLASAPTMGQEDPAIPRPAPEWDAERAEHLFNRAGFGASTSEIEEAVRRGPQAFVAELFEGEGWVDEPFYSRVKGGMEGRERLARMPEEERTEAARRMRREDAAQVRDFLGWWVERILEGSDDLRERMTLFWHGHFTSSMQDVKNSHEMIQQNQLLRSNALGNFGDLVHMIARDPAMLEYLDNDSNRKAKPNENFARELMELFTLGEGNYTEADVKEAARAFTGWTDRYGSFRFAARQHDRGRKTVLGQTGRFDGDDVIDILLEQEACARYIAGKLIAYLEGVAPAPERLEEYARFLRERDYEIAPFLERLFLDPDFYRDEVRGGRIASPLDFLVGACRRLGLEPPARLILVGSASLGEKLFHPPNVKGWEGGAAWITTASLMQRGNMAGTLLGEVALLDFLRHDPLEDPTVVLSEGVGQQAKKRAEAVAKARKKRQLGPLSELREVERFGWRPRMNLTRRLQQQGVRSDHEVIAALCDAVLAVPVEDATLEELHGALGRLRAEAEFEDELLSNPQKAEPMLRRLAHLILSMPEANLN